MNLNEEISKTPSDSFIHKASGHKRAFPSSPLTDLANTTITSQIDQLEKPFTLPNLVIRRVPSPPIATPARDAQERTALIKEAMAGNIGAVERLIREGVDLTEKDKEGNTALMAAVKKNHEEVVNLLLQASAGIPVSSAGTPICDATDHNGMSALVAAALFKKWNILNVLLDFGAKPNSSTGYSPLVFAVIHNETAVVKRLIQAGSLVDFIDKSGKTPLMWAIEKGNKEIIHLLTEAHKQVSSNINISNSQGHTALVQAIFKGEEIVRMLVPGSTIDFVDSHGKTPLMWAIEKGNKEIIQLLTEAHRQLSSNINISNPQGYTALVQAVFKGDEDIVRMLASGPNIDFVDSYGKTALMWAIAYGNKKITEVLIRAHANLDLRDTDGSTALMRAIRKRDKELVQLLVDAGASLDIPDHAGDTPLMHAILIEEKPIADLLEQAGADMHYATEAINRQSLAHFWGIAGNSRLINKNTREAITFPLEGMITLQAGHLLSQYAEIFFNSDSERGKNISPEDQEKIINSFQNVCIKGLRDNPEEIIKDIESQTPVIILGGFLRHTIAMVLLKDKSNEYKLVVCNRGKGSLVDTTTFYSINQDGVNKELIKKLIENEYKNEFLFNKMIKNLNFPKVDGFNQKKQKCGNCSWATSKNAFRVLCEGYTNRKSGNNIYKQFSVFVRQKALKDYLEQTQEPDKIMLQKILKKYNEKPNIFLDAQTLDKLKSFVQSEKT